ncbi:MAG: glycoside hydrolase family 130 protein [Chloroflexi bacterium]|nr:glycoside hydrolase family 130 protein [Chloroflexota bacterium]MBI2983645.1 glycoside hydrolase family 130 protein [Chloroflexota bacterium]
MSLGHRLGENPLLTARDVRPSLPELEVVSVFNAAVAKVGDEVILLLRVAEQPRSDLDPPADALTLDLRGPFPTFRPLPLGYRKDDVVGVCVVDTTTRPARVAVAYIPVNTPGLDLHDRRTIRYRDPRGAWMGADDGYTDHLAQMSHLRVARSRDGIHFEVEATPALAPDRSSEEYGIEDPRATFIDGRWYVTYVSVSRWGITTSLASTVDFRSFERHGVIFLPDHKDVVLFPERIGGKYRALTRPMPQSFGRILGIWIAASDDLTEWGGHAPICLPRRGQWDERRTGASAVPFRVAEGWLELYHGVDHDSHYAMGALLLDGDDPTRVLARSPRPILAPEEGYERNGLFNDTIFSCGHLDLGGGRIRLYYGAADSVLAAADFDVREIVASLEPWSGQAGS